MPEQRETPSQGEQPTRGQDGVATRRQLVAAGHTAGEIRSRLATGRWQTVHSGVYATFSGPIPPRSLAWAAILRAGPGAAAGPRTSLWLAGATDAPPARFDVVVPAERQVTCAVPFRVIRARGIADGLHPVATPPRLRVEHAALVACERIDAPDAVADLVIRVVQRRLTTADRLRAHLRERPRQRWRHVLDDLLCDVEHGVRSALELPWLRDVERAHDLPPSRMNHAEDLATGREYRDIEFEEFGLVVETDGREAHPAEAAFRDRRRDNRVVVSGRHTLRYGWHEITQDSCGVAGEVATVLRLLGWTEHPRPCRPGCQAPAGPQAGHDRGDPVLQGDSRSPRRRPAGS